MFLVFRKTLAFIAVLGLASAYTHMYFENSALTLYGQQKLGGTRCLGIDASFGFVRKTVMGPPHPYWLHGCPLFIGR
ncbi:MAG: hypothetical protein AAF141_08740 [Pseudomonadota bacterium]